MSAAAIPTIQVNPAMPAMQTYPNSDGEHPVNRLNRREK